MAKHPRTDDDEVGTRKRARLDSLFSELSLGDEIEINPIATTFAEEMPHSEIAAQVPYPQADLNMYIAQKLMSQTTQAHYGQFSMIRGYDYRTVVVVAFQRWVIRMFNRFIKRYNRAHGTKVPLATYYDKVWRMAAENGVSAESLFELLLHENRQEMSQLRHKLSVHEEPSYLQLQYTYWDTWKKDNDTEMENETGTDQAQNYEEVDMDLDDLGANPGHIEANYGSYYHSAR